MTYRGVGVSEMIFMGKAHSRYTHYILMYRHSVMFSVRSSTNLGWEYSFFMDSMEKYEQVKQCVMDAIKVCKDMNEMMDYLDEQFETKFKDIHIDWSKFRNHEDQG